MQQNYSADHTERFEDTKVYNKAFLYHRKGKGKKAAEIMQLLWSGASLVILQYRAQCASARQAGSTMSENLIELITGATLVILRKCLEEP